MKKISGILLLLTIFLTACSSGGDSAAPGTTNGTTTGTGTPTDPTIAFTLFPSDYFTSYDAAADLTGGDNKGNTITGTVAEQTLTQTAFNGDIAIPVETVINFNVSNGAFAAATLIGYFSIDVNDRRFLGENEDGVTITVSAITTAIPQTATIGDSGEIGVYTTNASDIITTIWRLEDGLNGNAKLIITSEERDGGGVLDNTFTTTYLIETDGTRITVEYVTFNVNVDLEVTLSGTY